MKTLTLNEEASFTDLQVSATNVGCTIAIHRSGYDSSSASFDLTAEQAVQLSTFLTMWRLSQGMEPYDDA